MVYPLQRDVFSQYKVVVLPAIECNYKLGSLPTINSGFTDYKLENLPTLNKGFYLLLNGGFTYYKWEVNPL